MDIGDKETNLTFDAATSMPERPDVALDSILADKLMSDDIRVM